MKMIHRKGQKKRYISLLSVYILLATLLMPSLGFAQDDSMLDDNMENYNLLYKDVHKDDYFAEALHFFTLTDLLPKADNELFYPKQPITRGEFFHWLHSFVYASGAENEWNQEKAAQALVDLKIITGYEDGSLRLNSTISRAEAAVILQRVLQLESSSVVLNRFTDVEQELWYSEAIGALANYQFIQGKGDGYFAPHDLMTKAEAITLLYRTLYQSKRIEDIRDGQLIINGQAFAYHPDLAGLFVESNRAALLNARVEYTIKDGAIETITSLYLNNKDSLSLDGNGAIIYGELFVSGQTVSISNLGIIGGLFVSSEVTDSFTSDALIVEGFTFFLPSSNKESSSPASLSVYAHDTSFGGLILSRNIQLQSFQKDIELVDSKPLAQKKLSTMKIASTEADENSPDIEKLLRDLSKEEDLVQLQQNIMDAIHNLTKIESGKITEEQMEEIINSVNNEIMSPEYEYQLDRGLPDINNRNNPDQDLREELRQKAKSEIEQRQREREQKQREIEEQEYSDVEQQDNTNKDIDVEFIIIGTPEDDGQDPPQLEIELEESEVPIIVISDTQLSTTDDGELSSVYLVDVAHFTVESDIEHLVIEQQDETKTTIAGRGQIGQLELRSGGQVRLAVQREIERLVISNPKASIHVDEHTIIENIELGEGLELEDVIQNIEDIGNNIRNINGKPYSPPKSTPSSDGGGPKTPGYSGEPKTFTATFDTVTVTGSVYKATASETVDGINFKLEIQSINDENLGDTVIFKIARLLLEQTDTVSAVEITGLENRQAHITLPVPFKVNTDKAILFKRIGERWWYRGGNLNADGDAIRSTTLTLDSTTFLAVAEMVSPPTNLRATNITADSVSLTWDKVPGATGYQVYRLDPYELLKPIEVVHTTTYTDKGLTGKTEYGYEIVALRGDFESEHSNQIYVTTD